MASKKGLKNLFIEDIERSGLTSNDAKKLKLKSLTPKETKSLTEHFHAEAYRIPYFDINGKSIDYYRLRFLEKIVLLQSKKQIRYWQPNRTLPRLYLPPLLDWRKIANDESTTLYITEGEKKAARACKANIPCVGLGGVWSWRSAKNGIGLIDDFNKIKLKGRKIVIVFDSDLHEKLEVQQALNELGKALTKMGAMTYSVKLPHGEGGSKSGLDDHLENKGADDFLSIPEEQLLGGLGEQLWSLNEELAYIEELEVILKIKTGSLLKPQSLVQMSHANRLVTIVGFDGKVKQACTAAEWLRWPHRRTHSKMTYAPGEDRVTEKNEYNLWKGWGTAPKKGNIDPWNKLLDYVFEEDPGHRNWFEQWLAYPLQNPGVKMFTSAVLFSLEEGVGKSLIGITMGRIYGSNYSFITQKGLHGDFNEWGANKQFVLGDDVTGSDRRADADLLKVMITRETMEINVKYQPKYTVPDRINYLFTTNQPDAFFMGNADRRYFVHEIKGRPLSDDFYKMYDIWFKSEKGPAALFHRFLEEIDCSKFNPRAAAPVTEAKKEMTELGFSEIDAWARELRESPNNILQLDGRIIDRVFWTSKELYSFYDPMGQRKSSVVALGKAMRRAGFAPSKPTETKDGKTFRLWAVRDVEKWRRADHHERVLAFAKERGAIETNRKTAKIIKF